MKTKSYLTMKPLKALFVLCLISVLITSCNNDDNGNNTPLDTTEEILVVANRSSSSISFIDAKTNVVSNTLDIENSEPIYVVYVPTKDKIYVGDRAVNKVHVINPETRLLENSIDVGNGVFHMWADGLGQQLWVVNDIDNSISVIDLNTDTVIETIDIGQKPHDVFVTEDGTTAYVSILDFTNRMQDKIVSYSTTTFSKRRETNVGKTPRLFHLSSNNQLYVPCEVAGKLYVLNGEDLSEIATEDYQALHGIFSSKNQDKIYMTSILGNTLYSINADEINKFSSINTLAETPHSITINETNTKAFVTHSGVNSNSVSVYTINGDNEISNDTTVSITVESNPFGLAYYKRAL